MGKRNSFAEKHPELFRYLPAEHVHPHDYFLARTILPLLPSFLTPNNITLIRIFMTPVVFLLILQEYYRVGIVLFLLVAFTDAIDGSLARTKNKITKFGMLFDPLADKLLIGSMVLLLVFRYFNFWLGIGILGLEIAMMLFALVAKVRFKTVRMANIWGKIKMISQVIAVFLTLLALLLNVPYLISVAAWIFGIAIGFAVISLFAHGI